MVESEFLRQNKNYLWNLIYITIITWIALKRLQFRNTKPEIDLVVNIWKKRQILIWQLRWGENSLPQRRTSLLLADTLVGVALSTQPVDWPSG